MARTRADAQHTRARTLINTRTHTFQDKQAQMQHGQYKYESKKYTLRKNMKKHMNTANNMYRITRSRGLFVRTSSAVALMADSSHAAARRQGELSSVKPHSKNSHL